MEDSELLKKVQILIKEFILKGHRYGFHWVTITHGESLKEIKQTFEKWKVGSLANETFFMVEEYAALKKVHLHILLNCNSIKLIRIFEILSKTSDVLKISYIHNPEYKEKKNLYNSKSYIDSTIEQKISYMLKEYEYWTDETRFYTQSAELTKLLSNNILKTKYIFLNYENKDNYLSGVIIIEALKTYFYKLKKMEINNIYTLNKVFFNRIIDALETYIKYFQNKVINDDEKEKIMLQILNELNMSGYLTYMSFYKDHKQIARMVNKIWKKEKDKEKEQIVDEQKIKFIIECLIKLILKDMNNAKNNYIYRKSYNDMLNEIVKYYKINKNEYDETTLMKLIVIYFNKCLEYIEQFFRIKQIYIEEKIKLEDGNINSIFRVKNNIKQKIIDLPVNKELIEKLNLFKGIMLVMPKPWKKKDINEINYTGGYILNEVFNFIPFITKKKENLSKLYLKENNMIFETINNMQKQNFMLDELLVELITSIDEDSQKKFIINHMSLKSLKIKKIFDDEQKFWNLSEQELKRIFLNVYEKKLTEYDNMILINYLHFKKYFKLVSVWKYKKIFFVNFCDFRLRIYYGGEYNIQMSKFLRHFLIFNDKTIKVNTKQYLVKFLDIIKHDTNLLIFKKEKAIADYTDWKTFIKTSIDVREFLHFIYIKNYELLKHNLIFIRLAYNLEKKKEETSIPYIFYTDVKSSGVKIFTFLSRFEHYMKYYIEKHFDFYLLKFSEFEIFLKNKNENVLLESLVLFDKIEKRNLFKKLIMIMIYGAGNYEIRRVLIKLLNEMKKEIDYKLLIKNVFLFLKNDPFFKIINFFKQVINLIFANDYNSLLIIEVADFKIELDYCVVLKQIKKKKIFGRTLTWIEYELNKDERDILKLNLGYLVNGVHVCDAYLCRNLLFYFLNKRRNIVSIHDSFGVLLDDLNDLKDQYLKLFLFEIYSINLINLFDGILKDIPLYNLKKYKMDELISILLNSINKYDFKKFMNENYKSNIIIVRDNMLQEETFFK